MTLEHVKAARLLRDYEGALRDAGFCTTERFSGGYKSLSTAAATNEPRALKREP